MKDEKVVLLDGAPDVNGDVQGASYFGKNGAEGLFRGAVQNKPEGPLVVVLNHEDDGSKKIRVHKLNPRDKKMAR
jgi:hypothetical protein